MSYPIAVVLKPGSDPRDIVKRMEADFGGHLRYRWSPLIRTPSQEVLADLQRRARMRDPGYRPFNADLWFRVAVTGPENVPDELLRRIMQRLRSFDAFVQDAYSMEPGLPPAISPAGVATARVSQPYLNAAPEGIGLLPLWSLGVSGCTGSGIGFADIERAWDKRHADLPAIPEPKRLLDPGFCWRRTHPCASHGIAVLGIVLMQDNGDLGVGIASDAKLELLVCDQFDGGAESNFPAAILAAAAAPELCAGDILLLEIQQRDENGIGGNDYCPVETLAPVHAAIRLATALGIVVVEAAGNWGDTAPSLDPSLSRESPDSGAILVAACDHESGEVAGDGAAHCWHKKSRYGTRVDCFAWGDQVYSTSPNEPYFLPDFSGTSAASAIIAGCALVVQSMAVDILGCRLSPGELRAIFRTVGTRSKDSEAHHIGLMPNLVDIRKHLMTLQPEVYLRSDVTDDGLPEADGVMSASPDIIVKTGPVDPAAMATGSGSENSAALGEPVLRAQPQLVYLRLLNRGKCSAVDVTLRLWCFTEPTQDKPAAWTFVGESQAPEVLTGGVVTVAPAITWAVAKKPNQTGTCNLIAVAGCKLDPMPATFGGNGEQFRGENLSTPELLAKLVRANNNVAWLKVAVV